MSGALQLYLTRADWLEVTANWDATTRDETTPEVSYENNAAWVAVRIEGAAVTVLDDDEVERVC